MLILALLACAPKVIAIAPSAKPEAPADGPPVRLGYPVDARPPSEHRDGGFYYTTPPVPIVVYGDANLRPSPMEALDRAIRTNLGSAGIPIDDSADALTVRVFVLHFAGTRDVSDASWVSMAAAGFDPIGKAVVPEFLDVDATLRIEVSSPDGTILAVRDVDAHHSERTTSLASMGLWSLWRHDVIAEKFVRAYAAVLDEIGGDVALVVDQARSGAVTAGVPPTIPAQHALLPEWSASETFDLRGQGEDVAAAAKYGSARFSMWSGHDIQRGSVVGRLQLPIDTLGYTVGLSDRVQTELDLTVLWVYDAADAGLQIALWRRGPWRLAVTPEVGVGIGLPPDEGYRPSLAYLRGGVGLMASVRPQEVTGFVELQASDLHVFRTFDAFPDLEEGAAVELVASPGLEIQLTPTLVAGVRLDLDTRFQNGDLLALGGIGPITPVPRIGIGLR